MQQFEYKVVNAPRRAKKTKGARTPEDRFARTLTDVINAEAKEGWEYLRADTLPVEQKKGLLSSPKEVFHTVLIFRRATKAGLAAGVAELRPVRPEAETPRATKQLGPAERGD